MKVLYAMQANGNGHISRANELLPLLESMCSLDILLSGAQSGIGLNHFIKYRRKGLSFATGNNGGIDLLKSLQKLKSSKFLNEAATIPVENYDLVINDFEPLTAWACKLKNIHCVALSHQFAITDASAPRPTQYDPLGWLLLRYFSPVRSGFGFHFFNYADNIYTPVIRKEIRNAYLRNLGHYTVYLPACSDKKIIKVLSEHKNIQWHIFSKTAEKNYAVKNCWIRPVNDYDYISSTSSSEGIICAAGFEAPAEALFMGKKLLVIPTKGEYEQQCNAIALKQLGVPVLKKLSLKKYKKIFAWLAGTHKIHIAYKDQNISILQNLLSRVRTEKALKIENTRKHSLSVVPKAEPEFKDEYISG